MLAVDLDKLSAHLPHQRNAGWLVVDENTGAAIRALHAAQNDVALIVNGVLGQHGAHGVCRRQIEHGDHLPLICAMAHQ